MSFVFYMCERNQLPAAVFRRGICGYTKLLPSAVIKCNQYNTPIEKLKARLRAPLYQRDMLAYEHASLELFDLIEEVDEEIQELQRQIRRIA